MSDLNYNKEERFSYGYKEKEAGILTPLIEYRKKAIVDMLLDATNVKKQ